MVISISKLAPRLIALAAVGYCVWPSLSDLRSETKPKVPRKASELATSLFSPKMSPSPTRNPFAILSDSTSATATNKAVGTGRAATSAGAKNADKPENPLAGFRLDATCILGNQRLAIINGQLYAAKDKLPSGDSSTAPFEIAGVLPYKVLLNREGKTFELTYSDAASRLVSSRQAVARTTSGAAAESPSTQTPPSIKAKTASGGNSPLSKAGT
jgi:hypothetical protein